MTRRRNQQRGFSLIELMVVVTIIGILAAAAVANVKWAARKAIDNFYADKQRYPNDLNELVPNYLRAIPTDPITKEADWDQIIDTPENPEEVADPDPEATSGQPGIIDVKSKATGQTLDGKPYNEL